MSSDHFVFSHLNFNAGDEKSRPARQRASKKEASKNEEKEKEKAVVRASMGMCLFATSRSINHSDFNPKKFVSTPLGYINKTIFARRAPQLIENPHYIDRFSYNLIQNTRDLIPENHQVPDFILETLILMPCDVPFRWGVLFNLKFRRMFECLNLQRWKEFSLILEAHGYMIINKDLTVKLIDPSPNEASGIEPSKTPISDPINFFESYISHVNSPPSSATKNIHIPRPAVAPVCRSNHDTIFSMRLHDHTVAKTAARFDPNTLSPDIKARIESLFEDNFFSVERIYEKLAILPINVPLRWGCIYNKSIRIRSRSKTTDKTPIVTLDQWKNLKFLLKAFGYLDDEKVTNCSILINKSVAPE